MGREFNPTKSTVIKIDNVLDSLKAGKTVTTACKEANIDRATFYQWKNHSDENDKIYYDIIDSRSLAVEDALFINATENGNIAAQIFWLKNRFPKRWKEKVESREEEILENLEDITAEIKELNKKNGFTDDKE